MTFEEFNDKHPFATKEEVWNAAQAQLKPSWDDAPKEANWRAWDEDGELYYYENKPLKTKYDWVCDGGDVWKGEIHNNWKNSLEQRP